MAVADEPFVATSLADSSKGSPRQVILDANANPRPDVIQFNLGGSMTITLVSSLPTMTDP